MGTLLWITAAFYFILAATGQETNPSMENCGISKVSSSSNKIVGGRNALPGEFPWQVSLEMRIVPVVTKFQHICGASVINENWAITAAHCIAGGYFTSYRIVTGTMNITAKTIPLMHLVIPYVHEGYNPVQSLRNDIALLRLTSPINIADSYGLINGVCLPSRSLAGNVTGIGTVTGWGTTSEGGSLSEKLLAVDVPIISDDKCREAYGDMIDDSMLCAGFDEGGKDSCQGDSGGPFVQKSSNGVSTLIGIVSWGKGCAKPNNPGVYTETAYFMDWIVRTMNAFGGSGILPGRPTSTQAPGSNSSNPGNSEGGDGNYGGDSRNDIGSGSVYSSPVKNPLQPPYNVLIKS